LLIVAVNVVLVGAGTFVEIERLPCPCAKAEYSLRESAWRKTCMHGNGARRQTLAHNVDKDTLRQYSALNQSSW
jgi:hypothetical protein